MNNPAIPTTAPAELRAFETGGPALLHSLESLDRWVARVPLARSADGCPLPYGMVGDVAVVSVEGPLMQRGGYYYPGYDAIADQVCAALSDVRTTAVVLKINSPGGEQAGCFEAVRTMREAAARAGKPLVAYADEMALSGGYALACAASSIFLPPLGQVGSVGAMSVMRDRTKMNEELGLKVVVIRSGPFKAEGHPDLPITDDVVAREQAVIDRMARTFAELVSAGRGLGADKVLALGAGVLWGPDAVAAHLADDVCTFTECLARASTLGMKTTAARAANATRKTMDEFAKKVLGMLNTANPEEALGRLSAWKDSHERLPAVSAELATARAAAATATEAQEKTQREAKAKADREAVVAEGERTMKVTPAEAAQIRAGEGWIGSQSTEQLRTMIAERAPLANLAAPQPGRSKIEIPGTPGAQVGEVVLTEKEIRIARQMGNDLDAVLAAKKERLAGR